MRVLLVNDYATPTAGAEIMLLALRDGLRSRGHDVRVFASRAQLIPGEMFADATCYGSISRLQVLSSTFNLSARRALRHLLSRFRPDIVHVRMFLWQLSPAILELLRPVPALYHVVTYKPICPKGTKMLSDGRRCEVLPGLACLTGGCLTPQTWLAMMVQHWLWRRASDVFDAVVTPSRAMKTKLEAGGVSPCEVLPNATHPRAARPPLGPVPVAAYGGRLSSEKGVDTLLHAFARASRSVPDARLMIAGDGTEAADMKALARSLGLEPRVEFTGALDREEMERRFDRAWVQVIPSKWDEPFGIVAIEAMMRGTAVVASRGGGLLDIVREGESGVLFDPGDVDRLTDSLIGLTADRELCERMGEEGRRVALEHYSMDPHIDRILALYERTLRKVGKK